MRRFMVSMCVLLLMTSFMGCQSKLGCRDCGGLLTGLMNRPRVSLGRLGGGCESGACRSGLFAPAQGFGNTGGGCASGGCGAGGGCAGGTGCGAGAGCGGGAGCLGHKAAEPPAGPPTGQYAYPYYTLRGPRDFLQANPPGIGP